MKKSFTQTIKGMFTHPTDLDAPLTKLEMGGGLIGTFGMMLVTILTTTFMSYYYTDIVGIGAAAVGTLVLIGRTLSAFSDIGMGVIISKTKSNAGRARPWVLRMMIPLALSVVLVFSVPASWGTMAKSIYSYITYIFMIAVAFSGVGMATQAVGPMMTSNAKSREKNALLGGILTMIAAVGGAIAAQTYTSAHGDTAGAWRTVAIVFAAITLVGLGISYACSKERSQSPTSNTKSSQPSFKAMLPVLLHNKYFIIMFIVSLLAAIDGALAGAVMYYFKAVLNRPELLGIVGLVTLVPTLAGLAITPLLAKRISKKTLMIGGLVIKVVLFAINALFPHNVPLYIALSILRSLVGGPMMALSGVFMLNTIEYGEYKTGIRAETMVVTASSFGNKVGTGIGGAIIGWLLALGGYATQAATQSATTQTMIICICCVLPAILAALQVGLLAFYDLDKRYQTIVTELKIRRAEEQQAA